MISEQGVAILNKAIAACSEEIERHKGKLTVKEAAGAVSEREDKLFAEQMAKLTRENEEMHPWESLPIVRNQEVCRMPSIGSIFATLDRCCQFQEHDARNAGIFPLIDPLDAFYLLNPSGDLSGRQDKFEDFFRERNLEVLEDASNIFQRLK